jgi:hypothetical protein
MPTSGEFGGNGPKILDKMISQYGAAKGKKVFFATLQKRGELKKSPSKRPTFGGKRSF